MPWPSLSQLELGQAIMIRELVDHSWQATLFAAAACLLTLALKRAPA
jgi:hypothetical protein